MIQPSVGSASVSQGTDQSLRNNSPDFTGSSADTVRGRSISRGKDFTGNDKCRRIGSKVLEEVAKTVQSKQTSSWDGMETKTDDAEKNGEDSETADLDGLATDNINGCNGGPIARNETGARQDKISHTRVV